MRVVALSPSTTYARTHVFGMYITCFCSNELYHYFRIWLFEEFLSEEECDGLMRVHNKHVEEQSKDDPILCFDSVSTLRKHLKNAGKRMLVTPNIFTKGML